MEIFILIPFASWSATLSKKTVKLTRNLFFVIRRHSFRLVQQTNSEIARIILANSHIARFVRRQSSENTIDLLQNNCTNKNPQYWGFFYWIHDLYTASNDFFSNIQAARSSIMLVYTTERIYAMRYVWISIVALVATRFFRFNDSKFGKNINTPRAK